METEQVDRHKRILIVEDEPALATVIADYVEANGMEAEILETGETAVDKALSGGFDLMVLDLMLPGKDGLSICRELRQSSALPIIMVTAKVEEIDRLLGLEMGADDYLCKPFSPRELVARVKAVLRRGVQPPQTSSGQTGRFAIDSERWKAAVDGKALDLTRREFRLLEILHSRPGRVYSRAQLLEMACPDDADVFDRTVDSHIKNIRSKIKVASGWEPIRSVYGVGYAFDE